jgi:hypothetical protein
VPAPGNLFEAAPASEDLVEVTAPLYKKPRKPCRKYWRSFSRLGTSLEVAGDVFVSVPAHGHFMEAEAVFEAATALRDIWRS